MQFIYGYLKDFPKKTLYLMMVHKKKTILEIIYRCSKIRVKLVDCVFKQ